MPPTLPTLPTTFDVPYSLPVGGTTWEVHSGDNLQTTLDAAALGDVIVIDAGATFTGNFKLPIKAGTDWLYIISSALASLPAEGIRVAPADATNMPCIRATQANNLPALMPFKSAHHYRFVGIEFKVENVDPISGTYNTIQMGYGSTNYSDSLNSWTAVTSADDLPSYIVFDRCYVHSVNSYPKFCRCGIMANGKNIAIVDSCLKNFADSSDAQAIWIWNGAGPYKIFNNYLEATGENIMVGGTDPSITDAIAEDIEFVQNYCYKDHATWTTHWTIKNLFELKFGRRVLCSKNLMENCYKDDQGQGATAIVLTVRDQSGANTGSQLQDITVSYNFIQSCGKAWRITGHDDTHPSLQTQRVLFEHNSVTDLSTAYAVSASGEQVSSIADGPALDITERHNLILANTTITNLVFLTAPAAAYAVENWTYKDNIVVHGNYGLFGNGVGTGTVALTRYATGTTDWTKNVLIDRVGDSSYAFWLTHINSYPAGNVMADGYASVGFTDLDASDYSLTVGSAYHNWGSDGTDPGPDWSLLAGYAALARSGGVGAAPSINIISVNVNPLPIRTLEVIFTSINVTGNVTLELSRDGGSNYTVVDTQVYSQGTFNYEVGSNVGGFCKVRLASVDAPAVTVESDVFSLGERYKAKVGRKLVGVAV